MGVGIDIWLALNVFIFIKIYGFVY